MGLRQWLFGSQVSERATYVGKADNGWWNYLPGAPSATSTVTASPQTAIGVATVYACISKISTTLAQLPIELILKKGDSFEKIVDNRTYLLNISPDNDCNAFRFRETMYAYMLLYGGRRAEIVRNRRTAMPESLRLLDNNKLEKRVTTDGRTVFAEKTDDGINYIYASDVLEFEYLFGQGPGQVSPETIGILKAAQDYAAAFFAGGGVMDGLLTSEQNLTSTQISEFLETWQMQKGKQTRLLPFGLKYMRMGVEPDKAQNTTSREFQSIQVCQLYNIDPRMIGINAASAYKSTEEASNHYAVHTITPLVNRLESELNFKMLFRSEQQNSYFRHNMDELVRGDMKTRAEVQDMQLKNGTRNINEVRATDLYNSVDGGDIHLAQVNQIDIKSMGEYSKKMASSGDAGNNAQ